MTTYNFEYTHNHGDTSWDEFVNPIIEDLEIEAGSKQEAIEKAEQIVIETLEEQSDNNSELMMKLHYTSPFSENNLEAFETMTTTITTFDDKIYNFEEAKEKATKTGEACRFKVGEIGYMQDEIVYAYFEVESHNNYAYLFEVRTDEDREATFVDTLNEDWGEAFDLIDDVRRLVDNDPGQIIDDLGIDHDTVYVGDQLHYFFDLDELKEAVNDRCDWLRHDVDSHADRANFHKVVVNFLNNNAEFIIEDLKSRDKEVTSLDLIDAINTYADGDPYKMLPGKHAEIIEGMIENEDRPFGINDDLLDLVQ